MAITPALPADAERPADSHGLRADDIVSLAAAIERHRARSTAGLSRPTLISADQELNAAAATAEGRAVGGSSMHA